MSDTICILIIIYITDTSVSLYFSYHDWNSPSAQFSKPALLPTKGELRKTVSL
jgi:hypothetical protein